MNVASLIERLKLFPPTAQVVLLTARADLERDIAEGDKPARSTIERVWRYDGDPNVYIEEQNPDGYF